MVVAAQVMKSSDLLFCLVQCIILYAFILTDQKVIAAMTKWNIHPRSTRNINTNPKSTHDNLSCSDSNYHFLIIQ